MGLVPPSTLWRCTKAVYGLKESPKMWETHRDKVLSDFSWTHSGQRYYLLQSYRHPSMWYIMKGKMKEKIKVKCLEDGDVPRAHDDLRGEKVGTFIVYVDDLLAVGEKKVLKGFFGHLQTVWEIATPEYLTREPEDVDSIRFLGMEIEKNVKDNNWIVHQQPYVVDTLNRFCPSLTPGDPEGFTPTPKP
eukprot:1931901-Amphidinium_carterae.2